MLASRHPQLGQALKSLEESTYTRLFPWKELFPLNIILTQTCLIPPSENSIGMYIQFIHEVQWVDDLEAIFYFLGHWLKKKHLFC